jgi:phage tail-like protein
MAVFRNVPYPAANFVADLGTGTTGPAAAVAEVVLPEARVQVVEYRSGNDKDNSVHKVPSTTEYTNLILRRGVLGALDWYDWWNQVRNGDQGAVRNVVIQLQDEARTGPVLTWKFLHARPVGHQYSPLIGQGPDVLIESLEIAFERVEIE